MDSDGASTNTSSSKSFQFVSRYGQRDRQAINKLDEYFKVVPEDFDLCNPIEWWWNWRGEFPHLYRLACNVLSIPGVWLGLNCTLLKLTDIHWRFCCCCGAYLFRWLWYHFPPSCKPPALNNSYTYASETSSSPGTDPFVLRTSHFSPGFLFLVYHTTIYAHIIPYFLPTVLLRNLRVLVQWRLRWSRHCILTIILRPYAIYGMVCSPIIQYTDDTLGVTQLTSLQT